jgi:hypothetical protein
MNVRVGPDLAVLIQTFDASSVNQWVLAVCSCIANHLALIVWNLSQHQAAILYSNSEARVSSSTTMSPSPDPFFNLRRAQLQAVLANISTCLLGFVLFTADFFSDLVEGCVE